MLSAEEGWGRVDLPLSVGAADAAPTPALPLKGQLTARSNQLPTCRRRCGFLALRCAAKALRDDTGAAAVSFILAFPIFLTLVGIVVQLALMVNAKLMVQSAADSAARAAVTSLPDGHPENISRAAWMAIAPLCPPATSTSSTASTDYDALRNLGVNVAESFPGRYSYAMEATKVSWSPKKDFAGAPGQSVEVTVTYKFQLTVPGAMRLAEADDGTVAGVKGRFWEVTAKSTVETAHGRKAAAQDNGWPR